MLPIVKYYFMFKKRSPPQPKQTILSTTDKRISRIGWREKYCSEEEHGSFAYQFTQIFIDS